MSFSLFGSHKNKEPQSQFADKVYVSTARKTEALLQLAIDKPETVFITWFPETTELLAKLFSEKGITGNRVHEARFIHTPILQHKVAVFAEHHPLHSRETALVANWEQESFLVFSAMDEPLFRHFGSEKMLPLMKLLGMKENESIEHSFVSKSITRGQEKIAQQVILEQPARSQAEWMEKHLK